MAYQLCGGRGVVPDLNALPPEGGEQAPPPAAEVDRISSLPEKARQRILGFLPLKTATMLGMVSRSWSRFVSKPQWPCDSILGVHIRSAAQGPCDSILGVHIRSVTQGPRDGCLTTHVPSDGIAPLLANELGRRGRGPGRRLLRFLLQVDDAQTRPADFDALLDYAADCVEHVAVVDARRGPAEQAQYLLSPGRRHASALPELSFNFPRASRHLLRLSLYGVGVNEARRPMSQFRSINTLEVLTIQTTSLGDLDLRRILLYCSRLRILILRNCHDLTCVNVTAASERLARLTVVECPQVDKISASTALGLRSFRYSGAFLRSVALPQTCFGDLYICFTKPFTKSRVSSPIQYHSWLNALPNLSNLVVLTICSNALRVISSLRGMADFQPQVDKLSNLPNLRELQLDLYKLNNVMLSQVYGFLRICRCSQLRHLFVELPTVRDESLMDAVSELAEEPPMDGFKNLVTVKITNFKWQCNEIELVHFLLRKVSSLQAVTLVVPKGSRDQSGNPIFPDKNLLCFEKIPANVKVVVLNESLGARIREFHRDVFLEFFSVSC